MFVCAHHYFVNIKRTNIVWGCVCVCVQCRPRFYATQDIYYTFSPRQAARDIGGHRQLCLLLSENANRHREVADNNLNAECTYNAFARPRQYVRRPLAIPNTDRKPAPELLRSNRICTTMPSSMLSSSLLSSGRPASSDAVLKWINTGQLGGNGK